MATFKARLKRTSEYTVGGSSTAVTIPFFVFAEPMNGWTVDSATFLIDTTTMCYNSSFISHAGAIRCTHVLTWNGSTLHYKTDQSIINQLDGNQYANCRQWPCCIYPNILQFSRIVAMASGGNTVITSTGAVSFSGTLWYLGLQTGTGYNYDLDTLRIYNMIDMTILEGTV